MSGLRKLKFALYAQIRLPERQIDEILDIRLDEPDIDVFQVQIESGFKRRKIHVAADGNRSSLIDTGLGRQLNFLFRIAGQIICRNRQIVHSGNDRPFGIAVFKMH